MVSEKVLEQLRRLAFVPSKDETGYAIVLQGAAHPSGSGTVLTDLQSMPQAELIARELNSALSDGRLRLTGYHPTKRLAQSGGE